MQDDFGDMLHAATVRAIGDRLDAGDVRMQRIEGDVATLRAQLDALRQDLAGNTRATEQVAVNTRELVDLFESFKGAIKVLNWLGKLARPVGYIAAACTAILALWAAAKGVKT